MIFWNNVISNNFSKKEILTFAKMFPCCSQFCWWLSLWNKPGSKLSSNLEARWAFLLWFSPYLRCDLWFAWGATLTPTLLWLLSSYYRQPGWSPWLLEPLKKKQRKRWSKVEQRRAKRDHRWKSGNIEIGKGSTKYNFNFKDVVFLQLQSNR